MPAAAIKRRHFESLFATVALDSTMASADMATPTFTPGFFVEMGTYGDLKPVENLVVETAVVMPTVLVVQPQLLGPREGNDGTCKGDL